MLIQQQSWPRPQLASPNQGPRHNLVVHCLPSTIKALGTIFSIKNHNQNLSPLPLALLAHKASETPEGIFIPGWESQLLVRDPHLLRFSSHLAPSLALSKQVPQSREGGTC